eukprot:SAG22_NODE_5042_length_1101_cov_25.992016_2_plen_67_part_01
MHALCDLYVENDGLQQTVDSLRNALGDLVGAVAPDRMAAVGDQIVGGGGGGGGGGLGWAAAEQACAA